MQNGRADCSTERSRKCCQSGEIWIFPDCKLFSINVHCSCSADLEKLLATRCVTKTSPSKNCIFVCIWPELRNLDQYLLACLNMRKLVEYYPDCYHQISAAGRGCRNNMWSSSRPSLNTGSHYWCNQSSLLCFIFENYVHLFQIYFSFCLIEKILFTVKFVWSRWNCRLLWTWVCFEKYLPSQVNIIVECFQPTSWNQIT